MATSAVHSLTVPMIRNFSYLASRTRYWTQVQPAVPPGIQFFVKQLGGSTDLRTGESSPQSSLVIAATLCVETPLDNHFCEGSFRALLLRSPRSKAEG